MNMGTLASLSGCCSRGMCFSVCEHLSCDSFVISKETDKSLCKA